MVGNILTYSPGAWCPGVRAVLQIDQGGGEGSTVQPLELVQPPPSLRLRQHGHRSQQQRRWGSRSGFLRRHPRTPHPRSHLPRLSRRQSGRFFHPSCAVGGGPENIQQKRQRTRGIDARWPQVIRGDVGRRMQDTEKTTLQDKHEPILCQLQRGVGDNRHEIWTPTAGMGNPRTKNTESTSHDVRDHTPVISLGDLSAVARLCASKFRSKRHNHVDRKSCRRRKGGRMIFPNHEHCLEKQRSETQQIQVLA